MINRFLIAAPIALVLSAGLLGVASTPASAATVDCTATPAQLRAAAATAAPDAQRKALFAVRTGEALCADDARAEAGKKFAVAAKALGLDLAALPATATAAN